MNTGMRPAIEGLDIDFKISLGKKLPVKQNL